MYKAELQARTIKTNKPYHHIQDVVLLDKPFTGDFVPLNPGIGAWTHFEIETVGYNAAKDEYILKGIYRQKRFADQENKAILEVV